jgi:predicted nucleic acid-binding Zn ribbon protein
MLDTWLPWSAPERWPKVASLLASCDAQVYRRCPKCGSETRIMGNFADIPDVEIECDACGNRGTTPVRHLEKVQCHCSSCGSQTTLMLAGNEVARCSKCDRSDVKLLSQEIVPPFPPRFSGAVASHSWGVNGNDDAIVTEM